MNASDFCFGFRIVGDIRGERRLVDAAAAFSGYAACDPRAKCEQEAYLSAFQFAADFREHLSATSSTAGFAGPCWSPWLWWDLDNEELQYAHKDAGALAAFLVERYGIEPGELLLSLVAGRAFTWGCRPVMVAAAVGRLPPDGAAFRRTRRRTGCGDDRHGRL